MAIDRVMDGCMDEVTEAEGKWGEVGDGDTLRSLVVHLQVY